MRWIRWWGVIVFVVMAAAASAFWLVFVDAFVKWSIEKTGTALVGAKVELYEADLTLFPLGLTLTGVQVTNPEEPMTNAVAAESAAMLIDGVNIFRRKVVIEDMKVEGIRLNTARERSGAVSRLPEREKELGKKRIAERFKLPALDVPDVKEVLAREELESVRLISRTRADMEQDRGRLEGELKGLADKKKLDGYRERFERIKSSGKNGVGGMLGATSEFLSLQSDIKSELERINAVKGSVEKTLTDYRERLEEAKKAPSRDIRRIKEKYGLTPEGFSNMARALLGPKVAERIDSALRWYKRLSPVVEKAVQRGDGVKVEKPIRGKGVDVRFPERNPVPDFLIRKASLSVSIPAGDISGRAANITDDQEVLGSPATFDFSGAKLKGLELLNLAGEINRVVPKEPKDSVKMKLRGYRVEGFELAGASALPLTLKDALADIDLSAIIEGDALDAGLAAGFSSVEITASGKEGMSAVERAVASALSGVRGFKLNADVSGALSDYSLKLSSDLDGVLKGALGKVVADQSAEFEKRLRAGVLERTKKPLEELGGSFSGLESIERELLERAGLTDRLLEDIGEAAMGGVRIPKLPF